MPRPYVGGDIAVIDARRQLRVLYREFVFRIVDLELISPHGDMNKLLGQFATILLLFSLWVSLVVFIGAGGRGGPPVLRLILSLGVEHFLIATNMLVVGLFAVLSWDSTFPDRRDVLVMSPLPVRARTIFVAKVLAVGTMLSLTMAVLNAFTGLAAPIAFTVAPSPMNVMRSFAAYWITMLASGTFIFCGVLTVQGAAQLLPRQIFLQVSSVLQLAAFCLLLTVYFLQPGFTDFDDLLAPQNRLLLEWLPSYWFLGLFEALNGGPVADLLEPLVTRGWIGLTAALCGATAAYVICYLRTLRKIVEEPDILPRPRRVNWLPSFGQPLETAVASFCVRTLVRSRRHRVTFSFYLGIALALTLFIAKAPVIRRQLSASDPWHQVNAPMLVGSILMMIAAVVGMRVVFSMPLELRAHWVFRVTPVRGGLETLGATRRSLFLLAVAPVWLVAAVVLVWLWPWRAAAGQLAFLGLLGVLLAEVCLLSFQKIPFTCSYQPGKSYVHMAALGFLGLIFVIQVGAEYELRALTDAPANLAAMLGVLGVAAGLARWRTSVVAKSGEAALEFESVEGPVIFALDLHRDGGPPV